MLSYFVNKLCKKLVTFLLHSHLHIFAYQFSPSFTVEMFNMYFYGLYLYY